MTEEEMLSRFVSGKTKSVLDLGTLQIKSMNKITANIIVKIEDNVAEGSLYKSISRRSLDINSSIKDIRRGNRNRQGLISYSGINQFDKNKPYIDYVKVFIETHPFIYVKY